jgi:hypothetical protein
MEEGRHHQSLAELHDLKVSRETLRSWMRQAGIWMSRAERKRIQQPRHRREHIGELVQIDGSEHRWFEDRAAACPDAFACSPISACRTAVQWLNR